MVRFDWHANAYMMGFLFPDAALVALELTDAMGVVCGLLFWGIALAWFACPWLAVQKGKRGGWQIGSCI